MTDAHEVLKVYSLDGRVRARDCAADRRRHLRRSPASGRTPKASTASRRSRTPARSTATTSRRARARSSGSRRWTSRRRRSRRRRSSTRRRTARRSRCSSPFKKGLKKDGQNPTYLYGYGGFDVSLTPAFSPGMIAWMEAGGIFAQPNLRGGGEYGKAWYDAGRLANKQNVFDDFIAAARIPDRREVHVHAEARDRRRQQRRPAGRRLPQSAPRPVWRGASRPSA